MDARVVVGEDVALVVVGDLRQRAEQPGVLQQILGDFIAAEGIDRRPRMCQRTARRPDKAIEHRHAANLQQFHQHLAKSARAAFEDDVRDLEVDVDILEPRQQPPCLLAERDPAMDDLEAEVGKRPRCAFEVTGVECVLGDDRSERYGLVHRDNLDAVLARGFVDREGDLGIVHLPLRNCRTVPAGRIDFQPDRVQQFDLPIQFFTPIGAQRIDRGIGAKSMRPAAHEFSRLLERAKPVLEAIEWQRMGHGHVGRGLLEQDVGNLFGRPISDIEIVRNVVSRVRRSHPADLVGQFRNRLGRGDIGIIAGVQVVGVGYSIDDKFVFGIQHFVLL